MHYVNWFEIILCVLLCYVECRPETTNCDAECRYAERERSMHPVLESKSKLKLDSYKFLLRDKRTDSKSEETSSTFWNDRAQQKLRDHLAKKQYDKVAKNVIFFLGDGMSIPTLAAARIYLGQNRGQTGEESHLSFEKFPHVGLSKTYCVDKQVPDSACTATAYLGGVKGNFQTVGVNAQVQLNDCKAANDSANHVISILEWAQRAGKSTGIVTTTTVTHASPAGNYAHSSNRAHESDGDIISKKSDPSECNDIASQLIYNEPGKNINVILGGGYSKFVPNTQTDPHCGQGERYDGRDLVADWKNFHKNGKVVKNKVELSELDIENTDHVLGLFASYHMDYHLDADEKTQPSLLDMTETAIQMLQKEEKGYFLFVEGGRIDHGHHSANAIKALDETVQFSNAIKRAVKLTSRDDTLIVVTSDHAHTMSISGYPDRGNPIYGLNTIMSDVDDLPTMTLSYANGPGYGLYSNGDGTRKNISGITIDPNLTYPGAYPSTMESHGGDDVAVFALGCKSHLFSGVYEQNVIPHIIRYASCLGDGLTACNER